MNSNRHWITKALLAVGVLSSTAAVATASATANRAPSHQATAVPASGYCDPLGGCASLNASPGRVKPGHTVRLHGSVGRSCKVPAKVLIYSWAFTGATRHHYRGVPDVTTRAGRNKSFSTTVRIRHIKKGTYTVQGHCGKSNFARAKLHVT